VLNPYQVHVLKIAMIDANAAAVVFSRFVKSETCKENWMFSFLVVATLAYCQISYGTASLYGTYYLRHI
jgi:hypothetical protein